ncbi:hypothetical protein GGF46_004528 [Coemansia sp. RSA 552]|nr:hypothetical protein GGF46_004528 [Coemansia sp. RSA 552]
MGPPADREARVRRQHSVPENLEQHGSQQAAEDTASRSHKHRRRRRSSSTGLKQRLGELFHHSSRPSVQKGRPEQGRPEQGRPEQGHGHDGSAPDTSQQQQQSTLEPGSGSDESSALPAAADEIPAALLMSETEAKMEHSSFLQSDESGDEYDGAAGTGQRQGTFASTCTNDSSQTARPRSLRSATTFTAQYNAVPTPGMWSKGGVRQEPTESQARPNMPLEPEEYDESKMPWIVEQMGMGEQPFSSLFRNDIGYANVYGDIASDDEGSRSIGRHFGKEQRRKQAFRILKRRVGEARVGVQREVPAPTVDEFRRPDGTADYFDFGTCWAKHYADTQLSHKLDFRHSSSDPCKLDRFLITLQRLVEVSAPYQHFIIWLYKLARWDNPKASVWWCVVYFLLLYQGMVAMFLWMAPAFIVAYHRLRPSQAYQWLGFERPETSVIPSKIVQEASSGTLAKGLIANRMWDIWRDTLGAHIHVVLADLADWMERAKNCATWKRPWASRAIIVVLICAGLFTYLIPAAVFQKLFGICVGVQFFFLAPLQLRHQRYRRMLWIIDIILWHCPNDVELSLDALYMENRGFTYSGPDYPAAEGGEKQQSLAARLRTYARVLAADLTYAYNPFAEERRPPVMVLQTASSTALDQIGDDITAGGSNGGMYEAFMAGRVIGKNIIRDAGKEEVDQYTGLGADKSMPFLSVMGEQEELERERIRRNALGRHLSTREPPEGDPTASSHSGSGRTLQGALPVSQPGSQRKYSSGSNAEASGSGSSSPSRRSSLLSRAKDLTSRVIHRRASQSSIGSDSYKHTASQKRLPIQTPAETSGKDMEDERKRRLRFSLDLKNIDLSSDNLLLAQSAQLSKSRESNNSGGGGGLYLPDTSDIRNMSRESLDSILLRSPTGSAPTSAKSGRLELTHEVNRLKSLRNKDARAAKDSGDLSNLYAFRCIHQGKYGTLFVTSDRFVFRRSRIMGGRRSSVSSYLLSSVVAIRKIASGIAKSHGIQLLLSNGRSCSFYGLKDRDAVFGFLLVRCGNGHLY